MYPPPTVHTVHNQCCQLLADFSGQFAGKIWPLRKKFGPLIISPFETFLPLETKLSLSEKTKKTNFPEVRPLSVQNQPKFGRKFVQPRNRPPSSSAGMTGTTPGPYLPAPPPHAVRTYAHTLTCTQRTNLHAYGRGQRLHIIVHKNVL